MTTSRILFLTSMSMIAFAGNSLLCRVALRETGIDAASFTLVRIASGAISLWLIISLRRKSIPGAGNWFSAFALFAYAAAFSFAYIGLTAATGALLLFGAVQATMICYGLLKGERFTLWQWLGLGLAGSGLIGLMLPGLSAPPLGSSFLMVAAGVAWGAYSLRGRGTGDPTCVTAGNFLRAVPFAAVLSLAYINTISFDAGGIGYAVVSGALASGVGYALWYSVLPALRATHAATLQLSVPVIAALGGVLLLGEPVTWRLILASLAILGGIALVILRKTTKI